MSSKKFQKVNLDEILSRVRLQTGLRTSKNLAQLFGLSPSNFSNRKKRATLLPVIVEWAINEDVNLQWLLTGGDEPFSQHESALIPDDSLKNRLDSLEKEMADLKTKIGHHKNAELKRGNAT